jgi:hypothetical protein
VHDVYFDTQGSTQYHVQGRSRFVVAMDRTKTGADLGRFSIYLWEDLGAVPPGRQRAAVRPLTWTGVKLLYGTASGAGASAAPCF